MRGLAFVAATLIAVACTPPQIATCEGGRFARVEGEPWCLIPRGTMVGCPNELPAEHDLPWGGRGCARTEHDTLPEGLCAADPECERDAG